MNKLQAIETFSEHFNDLVDRNKRSWELENSTRDTTLQQKENYYQQELGEKLESMCVLLGIEIEWPGLYPSFKVDGYTHHCIEDALAAVNGHRSIGLMKYEYAQQ